jgi:hypothetical protein
MAVASLSRPFWSSSSWAAATAAAAVAVSGVAVAALAVRLRSLSLGLITALALLLAFWAKWVFGSEPLTYFQPVPHDNDAAIEVTAAFAVPFAFAWLAGRRLIRQRGRSALTSELPGRTTPWILLALGCALVALRVVAAKVWTIGVPGQIPAGLDIPGLKSIIFHAGVYGPLICATLILVASRSMTSRALGGALLVVYAAAGAALGSRGAVTTVALVAAFVILRQPPLATRRNRLLTLALWCGAALALTAAIAISLTMRSAGSDSSSLRGALTFISERVGGLDYLSVAVSGVDRLGTSWSYLDSTQWSSFLTYEVYGYPPEAVTGAASTLPGLAYGIAGWGTVLVAGLIFGVLCAVADVRLTDDRRTPAVVLSLGLVIAWSNLLLEGTLQAATLIALFFAGVAAMLLCLPALRRSMRRPPDRSRDVDAVSS